jgi:renalase
VFVNDDPVLTWIADDGRRRGDDAAVLVAHAHTSFSARHLTRPEAAAPELVEALLRILDIPVAPSWFDVKRWTCARPVTAWPDPYHLDPRTRVGLAGDGWHAGPRVECAYLSGAALGRALAALT